MCKTCNPGTFVSSNIAPGNSTADCQVCPTGTNKSIEAGFRACPCLHGYFRKDRFGPCEICPKEGVDCLKEYQQLKPGFHWVFNHADVNPETCDIGKLEEYLCFTSNLVIDNKGYDKRCTRFNGKLPKPIPCPGGIDACPVKGDAVNMSCAGGYEGLLCSQCSHDHYSWFEYCLQCPSAWYFALECIFVLAIFVLFIAIAIWDYKQKGKNKRTIVDILISRAKIILNYYQVVGAIFASLHGIQWPKQVSSFGSIFRLLELNIFKLVAKPRCYITDFHLNVYRDYLIGMTFIGLVPVLALCAVFVVVLWKHFWITNHQQQRRKELTQVKQRCYLFVVSMLYITYLSVVNAIMALLPPACYTLCLAEGDDCCLHRLRDDLSIDCKTEQHQKYTDAAYGSLVYVFGFPLILLFFLWRSSKSSVGRSQLHIDLLDPVNDGDNNNNANVIENDNSENDNVIDSADSQEDISSNSSHQEDDDLLNINSEGENELVRADESDEEFNLAQPGGGAENIEHLQTCNDESDSIQIRGQTTDTNSPKVTKYPLYLRFLCENYKDTFWYWEILELTRKVLQTVLVVLFGSKDPLTLGITIALSVVFLTSHAYFKPMKDKFEHWLQMVSLAAIFFNLLLASMLLIPSHDNESAGRDRGRDVAMAVFLVAVNVLVIAMALGKNILKVVLLLDHFNGVRTLEHHNVLKANLNIIIH